MSAATADCRCYGCASDRPMACGSLCADCSWEDHCAGMAHTGSPYDEPHEATPTCCLASCAADAVRYQS